MVAQREAKTAKLGCGEVFLKKSDFARVPVTRASYSAFLAPSTLPISAIDMVVDASMVYKLLVLEKGSSAYRSVHLWVFCQVSRSDLVLWATKATKTIAIEWTPFEILSGRVVVS